MKIIGARNYASCIKEQMCYTIQDLLCVMTSPIEPPTGEPRSAKHIGQKRELRAAQVRIWRAIGRRHHTCYSITGALRNRSYSDGEL